VSLSPRLICETTDTREDGSSGRRIKPRRVSAVLGVGWIEADPAPKKLQGMDQRDVPGGEGHFFPSLGREGGNVTKRGMEVWGAEGTVAKLLLAILTRS